MCKIFARKVHSGMHFEYNPPHPSCPKKKKEKKPNKGVGWGGVGWGGVWWGIGTEKRGSLEIFPSLIKRNAKQLITSPLIYHFKVGQMKLSFNSTTTV